MKRPTAAGAAAILSVTALGSALVVGRSGNTGDVVRRGGNERNCDFDPSAHKVGIGIVISAPSSSDSTRNARAADGTPTPSAALAQALQSGNIPDSARSGSWIRLHVAWRDLAVFFRGIGVSPSGDVQPGHVVMGDVASFSRGRGGWTSAATTWSYCDPARGRPSPSTAHVAKAPGDVDYRISFPHSASERAGTECALGTVDAFTQGTDGVTHLFVPKPLSALSLTSLRRCVATHQGTLAID